MRLLHTHTKKNRTVKDSLVRYLGDLEGVPSGLLVSISLCSCFCIAILSAACLHDKNQTDVSKAETSSPVKKKLKTSNLLVELLG